MKLVYRYFFRGFITFLPLALTVYLLYLFVAGAESAAVWLIRPLIGDFYLPGLGIVVGMAIILALGFLVSQPITSKMLSWVELPFTRLPVVKSIYSSLTRTDAAERKAALDAAVEQIQGIWRAAREGGERTRPRWPTSFAPGPPSPTA